MSFNKINVGSPDFKDLLVLAEVHGRLLASMGACLSFDLIYNSKVGENVISYRLK